MIPELQIYRPEPEPIWTIDSIGKSALVLTVYAGLIWMAGALSTIEGGW